MVDHSVISIKGARVHNLKNIDLKIPLEKITCFAGPSGSGKSSLAFHTLLTESKRRFLNSFPNYLKFFSERPAAVDVDEISPVLPVFGLPQINPVAGARSVVADIMGLTEIFQTLFYQFSIAYCPVHDCELIHESLQRQISKQLNFNDDDIVHIFTTKSDFLAQFSNQPYPSRVYNQDTFEIIEFDESCEYWELFRFKKKLLSKLDQQLKDERGRLFPVSLFAVIKGKEELIQLKISNLKKCPQCDYTFSDRPVFELFTPYTSLGACTDCNGHGANLHYDLDKLVIKELSVKEGAIKFFQYKPFHFALDELIAVMKAQKISTTKPVKDLPKKFWDLLINGSKDHTGFNELYKYLDRKRYKPSVRIYIRSIQKEIICQTCHGTRLNSKTHFFKLQSFKKNISTLELWHLRIEEALVFFEQFKLTPSNDHQSYQFQITLQIKEILKLACEIGLGHLSLKRRTKTASPGEYQRLLLLKYLSYEGTGALFIFDEPSLGLSEKEQSYLFKGFQKIQNQGNTIIIIDHAKFFHINCDHFILMGPGSGKEGGQIIYQGPYQKKLDNEVLSIEKMKQEKSKKNYIYVEQPQAFNNSYDSFKIPCREFVWVKGQSGTGKTSCMLRILAQNLLKEIKGEKFFDQTPEEISGLVKHNEKFDDIIVVTSDLNRYTSRSSVGSLTGLSGIVRKHFLSLPVSKSMKLKEGHLSSNSKLGQCPACEGRGFNVIDMQYMEDIVVECEECQGDKIQKIYASISDGQMTVLDSYNMPLSEVLSKVSLTPKFKRIYEYMKMLNLTYLNLDRPLNSLSGGERQRIFLLSKLLNKLENSFIIFENLTFGLSEKEVVRIGHFLNSLIMLGNSVVVIDQNSLFEKFATYTVEFQRLGKISTHPS